MDSACPSTAFRHFSKRSSASANGSFAWDLLVVVPEPRDTWDGFSVEEICGKRDQKVGFLGVRYGTVRYETYVVEKEESVT